MPFVTRRRHRRSRGLRGPLPTYPDYNAKAVTDEVFRLTDGVTGQIGSQYAGGIILGDGTFTNDQSVRIPEASATREAWVQSVLSAAGKPTNYPDMPFSGGYVIVLGSDGRTVPGVGPFTVSATNAQTVQEKIDNTKYGSADNVTTGVVGGVGPDAAAQASFAPKGWRGPVAIGSDSGFYGPDGKFYMGSSPWVGWDQNADHGTNGFILNQAAPTPVFTPIAQPNDVAPDDSIDITSAMTPPAGTPSGVIVYNDAGLPVTSTSTSSAGKGIAIAAGILAAGFALKATFGRKKH